ncbi:lipocalin-like domain-containing protein [Roseateles sp. BYS180W]|uniref:Lipocalin-like domain-containing protein n=1 Tax=Roseateles rivi TaxID=3299028 RepID=A0ABW7FTE3_9BURK
MFKQLSVALVGSALALGAYAQDQASKVQGLWKLVSYQVETKATGELDDVMGKKPTGYVNFGKDGRVFFILTGEGRTPGKSDAENAKLLSTLVSYTGSYELTDTTFATNVEVAWNPAWVGTKQVRNYKLDGTRLQVLTPWRVMPNWPEKGESRSIVTFERAAK